MNLQEKEAQLHSEVNQYAKLVDDFQNALNDRTSKWHTREVNSAKLAAARNHIIILIATGAIALGAIIAFLTVVLKG